MSAQWTPEQVLALAPDSASAKNGRSLATLSKWSALGEDNGVIWGQCQGSGKEPYRTQIAIAGPAFRCSCPSRKFPCKHGLALFLLFAEQSSVFVTADPPDWVAEWLLGRSQRAEKQVEKQTQAAQKQADPVAQAKRTAARQQKVEAGVQDLRCWLEDRVRQGLVTLQQESYQTWETMAARMVDAQAPGLARRLRKMAGLAHSGQGWMHQLMAELSQLYLLLEGFEHLETLPTDVQADLKTQMGWTVNQTDVLNLPSHNDLWLVTGQRIEEEDRLKVRRTWLWGVSGDRPALLLDFAHGHQTWEHALLIGSVVAAELTFYPSAYPLRALIKSREANATVTQAPPGVSLATAISTYQQAMSRCPWMEYFPVLLSGVTPIRDQETWLIQDSENYWVPLKPQLNLQSYWKLLALSGGHPVTVFGEWDGTNLLPLSLWAGDVLYALGY